MRACRAPMSTAAPLPTERASTGYPLSRFRLGVEQQCGVATGELARRHAAGGAARARQVGRRAHAVEPRARLPVRVHRQGPVRHDAVRRVLRRRPVALHHRAAVRLLVRRQRRVGVSVSEPPPVWFIVCEWGVAVSRPHTRSRA